MNENEKRALAHAVALTQLAASSALGALRLSDDRSDWALADALLGALRLSDDRSDWALADALYWAARAAAQAARRLGDENSADSANEVADGLVSLAEDAGHTIRR